MPNQKVARESVYRTIMQARLKLREGSEITPEIDQASKNGTREKSLLDEITHSYRGTTNEYLAEIMNVLIGNKVEVIGEPDLLFTCPCCSFRTLDEKYDLQEGTGYDICDYCRWEDDGTTDEKLQSGVNRCSLSELRARIVEHPSKYTIRKWVKDAHTPT